MPEPKDGKPAQNDPNGGAPGPEDKKQTPPPQDGQKPPEGDGKPQDKQEPPKDQKPTGAPEQYTEFKLPEGIKADKDALEGFSATAKKLNLTQAQAQELVDFQAAMIAKQSEAIKKQVDANKAALAEETKAMLGPDYEKKMGAAAKALERFGTPELKKLLDDTGFGSHKDLVNFCIKIGDAISEDRFVEAKPGGPKDAAEILYGKK